MPNDRSLLEREMQRLELRPFTLDGFHQRRERRQRNRRIRAGVVALVVVVAGAGVLVRAFPSRPVPAGVPSATPTPEPAKRGSLAYGVDGDIYVADWDGSNPVRIADGRPPNQCGAFDHSGEYWGEGPIWSPDGRYLAFRHRNCAVEDLPTDRPPDDLWGDVVISDSEGKVIASFPTGTGWDIAWSPDSTRVAVWVRYGATIGVFGIDGKRQALLSVPSDILSGDHDPVWLPDGESLLLPWEDVVVPIDGSTPYQLHLTGRHPTYSPDGSRVAYLAKRSLVVAEADGSNPQVVFDGWVMDPVWSPTGDHIVFTSRKPGSFVDNQLRVLDVATGTMTLLFEADGSGRGREVFLSVIDFSPEGDRILFSRQEAINDDPSDPGSYRLLGAGSLWSVDEDGSDPRRVVAGTTWGDWLSPSPTS